MDNDRITHSLAVARKMMEIAKERNLNDEQIRICFLIGYNHDIGYEFAPNGFNHNKAGGEILKNIGFKYWREIYYHGDLNPNYESIYLNILNQADMQVDRYGNFVSYNERLEDIKNRYGENSDIYKNCFQLIKKIKHL